MSLVLIDSSSWIEAMRPGGDATVRMRVQSLLKSSEAAWCEIIRVELWKGARGVAENAALAGMDASLPRLEINQAVWSAAVALGIASRTRGLNLPASDLVIAACGRVHGVAIESVDRHFQLMATIP